MKQFGYLERRAAFTRAVRSFFEEHGFVEITTQSLIAAPAPEEFIESIAAGGKFLRASPELALKILLSRGAEKIFELGPCFRAGEYGRKHREEFTMLEWYEKDCDYMHLLSFTAAMFRFVAEKVAGSPVIRYGENLVDLAAEPEILSVEEAFTRYSRYDMFEAMKLDVFDEEMVTRIEPELGKGRLTFLTDYPAERASLARLKQADPRFAERWELYVGGLELANAYSELIDAAEQKKRFHETMEFRRKNGMLEYPEASEFFAALERGIGECAGCALGFDRMMMVLLDCNDISEVIP